MIPASNPVSIPSRTLDRWWIEDFRFLRDPKGKMAINYHICRGDEDGFVISFENQLSFQTIGDVEDHFSGDDISLKNVTMLLAAMEALIQVDLQTRNSDVLDKGLIKPVEIVDPANVLQAGSINPAEEKL